MRSASLRGASFFDWEGVSACRRPQTWLCRLIHSDFFGRSEVQTRPSLDEGARGTRMGPTYTCALPDDFSRRFGGRLRGRNRTRSSLRTRNWGADECYGVSSSLLRNHGGGGPTMAHVTENRRASIWSRSPAAGRTSCISVAVGHGLAADARPDSGNRGLPLPRRGDLRRWALPRIYGCRSNVPRGRLSPRPQRSGRTARRTP